MSCVQCTDGPGNQPPRLLVCGHSICSKCTESDKCPVCLRKALVDHLEVDKIPDCVGCLAKEGSVYCHTCLGLHCVECDAFFHSKVFKYHHSRAPRTESHPLRMTCACHSKPLSYFCTTCEMRVCEDCVTKDLLSFRTTGRLGGGLDGGEVGAGAMNQLQPPLCFSSHDYDCTF